MPDPTETQRPLARLRPGTPLGELVTYEVCREAANLFMTGMFGYETINRDRVPPSGPVLIVANHESFLDPTIIGSRVRHRQLDYVARASLFKPPFARVLHAIHAFPIADKGDDIAAMKEALRRLGEGRAVVIFPEGSRTFDGTMQPFKRGAGLIIKRANCMVLPAAIAGAFRAWPRNSKLPRFRAARVGVAFGHPIPPQELRSLGSGAIDRLQHEVQALRGTLAQHGIGSVSDAPAGSGR
ncbi:MAG: lysophospholipid acyltransferase family protein [Planctomycetota bacterium]